MRLTALTTELLDQGMRTDLAKLFTPEQLEQLEEQAAEAGVHWVLAKFNGRYIGAGLFNLQAASLIGLTVRDVTRRRGVGRLLIDYCLQQIKHVAEQQKLFVYWDRADADIAGFMSALAATPSDKGWHIS
ncbi:GNAT family N-acetyltransferase [Corallincola luteus]|uniref:GNAT family N-acetyltransferase n=2 Tax=Corallincola TaxID=1775176 RepID=A0A368NKI8_9GAMM|nr:MULTISPECIES: acetyl-CoA sensor PanZ family protein [Corallincola]RCU50968.1 GNAT family N-acetyltransferase [Corallincola holothuriorum]TCI04030.1 GNAT family N-acetyltransferase [Corallincola luteus]